ncbi:MAG TPA: SUF system Fe-S cluster assembly regulator [Burkholderiaceae bacterium]|nr:SUF system Fe-S cluster assembly regulator [Burkholderiaceae bacterium]
MLRLSKLTDYGTVVMAHLARHPDRLHSAAEVAAEVGVGLPTASKILKMLAQANLVQSARGAKGGYALARPATQISMAEVIDAIEGPVGLTECSVLSGLCAQEKSCSIRGNWQRINQVIRRALTQMTLEEMAQPRFHPIFIEARRPREHAPARSA